MPKSRPNFSGLCDGVADWLERHSWLALGLFSLVFLGVTGFIGATKLMDFDEIFTYYPARQAEVGQVWSFFSEGMETNTPTNTLLAHGVLKLLGDNPLVLRLPAIFGYWVMCLCIYAFVSFRCSKVYGMAAMLLPPITSVYFYATEARAYGVILGASALALVAWQRATSSAGLSRRGLWLAVLWLSLGLCVSLHYLALFLWVPLGCAELVRAWERKRADWPMALVLVLATFPLGVFLPMMLLARKNFLGSFWARPSLGDIENTYRSMLTLAFAPLLGGLVAWVLSPLGANRMGSSRQQAEDVAGPPLAERVLIVLLALTPAYVVPAMMVVGTFVPRYVLFAQTGLVILLATAAFRHARGNAVFAVVMVACLGGWFLLKYPNTGRHQMAEGGLPAGKRLPFEAKPWMLAVTSAEQAGLPVIASPAVFFLQLQHYSRPAVRERTYYLTSIPDAMKFDGTDTGDLNLQFFSRRFPVQVPDYYEFTKAHREFLLLAETTNPTWVIEKLLADGANLQLIRRDQTYFLYHVSLNGR